MTSIASIIAFIGNSRRLNPIELHWEDGNFDLAKIDRTQLQSVRGDFIHSVADQMVYICDRPMHFASYRLNDKDCNYFKVDLFTDARSDPRTVNGRPNLFDYRCHFAPLMMMRWWSYKFEFTIDAADLGLEYFFGTREIPWHVWSKITLVFCRGVLRLMAVDGKSSAKFNNFKWTSEQRSAKLNLKDYQQQPFFLELAKKASIDWLPFRYSRIIVLKPTSMADRTDKLTSMADRTDKDLKNLKFHKCVSDGCVFYWTWYMQPPTHHSSSYDDFKQPYPNFGMELVIDQTFPRGVVPEWKNGIVVKHIDAPRYFAWYQKITDIMLALLPLNLPAYILLWLIEWVHVDTIWMKEIMRIKLIQGLIESRCKIVARRVENGGKKSKNV